MHPSEIGMKRSNYKSYAKSQKCIFEAVNDRAHGQIESLAKAILPNHKKWGNRLVALNPTRSDKNYGSFGIDLKTGKWADFAVGDSGGDIISFYAYVNGTSQIDAAKMLAEKLGVSQ